MRDGGSGCTFLEAQQLRKKVTATARNLIRPPQSPGSRRIVSWWARPACDLIYFRQLTCRPCHDSLPTVVDRFPTVPVLSKRFESGGAWRRIERESAMWQRDQQKGDNQIKILVHARNRTASLSS